jgi:chromate transporter
MAPVTNPTTEAISPATLALYFLRLGLIGFGGPPAHIALMQADLVEKRRWLTREQFDADLATANLLPGPTSTELAIYIGMRMHGAPGAIIAGVCFILPAALIVGLLAWAYTTWGQLTWLADLLYGVKPAAFALVLHGLLQLARGTKWTAAGVCIAGASLAALLWTPIDVLLLFVLAGAAAVAASGVGVSLRAFAPIAAYANIAAAPTLLSIFWEFLKIGAVIYGGGFALIGILQQSLVQQLGWITQQQLLDAIAVGQSTPGPVFTTATFIGFLLGGPPGAVLATIGIFAPAFVFVRLEQVLLARIRRTPWFRTFLHGVNLAVLASLTSAALALGRDAIVDVPATLLCAAAMLAMAWKKVDAHWIVGAGLAVGLIRLALF